MHRTFKPNPCQLELGLRPPKGASWKKRGKKPSTKAAARDRRTKDNLKHHSKGRILVVVERVLARRGLTDPVPLFSAEERGTARVASARSLAMAACAAVGIPLCHIARAFSRSWATVHAAELHFSRRYQKDPAFRPEWDAITEGLHQPEAPQIS